MSFGYTGGATNGADSGTTATVTHGQTINSGDLVVFYVNSNSTTLATVDSDAGAAWTTAGVEVPSGETANQGLAWKIADGSEPASYSWTVVDTRWRVIVAVFTSAVDAVVDAPLNTHIQTGNHTSFVMGAYNGQVIADDALAVIFGGKDNFNSNAVTTSDNSYTTIDGREDNQASAGAYRIYTTDGETASGNVTTTVASGGKDDKTYSMHISFVEGGAAASRGRGSPLESMMAGPLSGPIG